MSGRLVTLRASTARASEADGRLPFPFLTLCWRIGVAGQWIRVPRISDDADSALPRLSATPALVAGSIALSPFSPIARYLDHCRFVQRVRTMDDASAAQAVWAALGLLLAAPGPSRTRSLPPLWRPLAAAVMRGSTPGYIPRPHPRYDPLTWTLLDRLLEQWETEGLTFIGPHRRQLYLRAGTRRMARTYGVSRRRALACGRTAHRIWRHWYETSESPREARIREFPLPRDLFRTLEDPARLYRAIRHARRAGQPIPYVGLLPGALVHVFLAETDASIASFPPSPTAPTWPEDPVPCLARALQASPLAAAARRAGVSDKEIRELAGSLAAGLLRLLTAPWPWGRLRCPS